MILSLSNRPTSQRDLPFYRVNIFGDSITKYLPNYLQSEWFVPEVFTKPGCTVSRMVKTLRNVEPETRKTHVVIFHIGTNDLENSVLHQDLKNFKQLIIVARHRFPEAQIFVSAILPRHDFDELNYRVQILNLHLAKLCKQLKFGSVDYTDHFTSSSYMLLMVYI